MKKYTIEVPYEWSSTYTNESTTEVELYAKSEEQARGMAKRIVGDIACVNSVGSTTIIDVEE